MLLTYKTSNVFRNYNFRIVTKNLTKCNILKIFAFKNDGKLVNRRKIVFIETFKKLCSRFLALVSSIPVLGLFSVCPRKLGCYPWPQIFLEFLTLASKVLSSIPPLIQSNPKRKRTIRPKAPLSLSCEWRKKWINQLIMLYHNPNILKSSFTHYTIILCYFCVPR